MWARGALRASIVALAAALSPAARADVPPRPDGFETKRAVKVDTTSDDFLPVELPSGEILRLLTFVAPGPVFTNYVSTGDLPELKKLGALRVLVHGAGDLWAPAPGTPEAHEQFLVEELAEQLGLRVEWVLVEARAQLVDALDAGRGDLIAAGLTPIDDTRVALAQPLRRSPWVLAGARGHGARASLTAIGAETILVRPGSAAVRALSTAAKKAKASLKLVAVPDALSDDELLRRVARQKTNLALVPRALAEAHAEALEVETVLALPVPVAESWAVRKSSTKLRAALDSALTERALRGIPDAKFVGDLDGIRQRGVLRLLTKNDGRSYFVRSGARAGLELELAELFAEKLAVRLEVVVAPSDAQLVPWLLEGRGDLVGAGFIHTAHEAVRLRVSRPYATTRGAADARADALVLAVRPTSAALATWIDRELAAIVATEAHRGRVSRYLDPPPPEELLPDGPGALLGDNQISPFDGLIRKYAEQYSIDWRLSAAQAFAESRFRAHARSRAGALGLFQVMPRTGKSLGFDDLADPEQSTHAGIKYLSQQLTRFDPGLPLAERVRFALASYNAGYGHVADARRLALEEGLDPDTWTGAVERALLLLEHKEYAQRAPSGWCRGSETVRYVQKILNTYDRYVTLVRP
ncbi:transglycosylase SLT domain-containing protein [Myxococcota bacterium]|nr:transglycosylase SLT domain-containing protein [Myxococcota bacterium]